MERQHASSLAERLRRNNRVDLPECPTADQLPNNREMAHYHVHSGKHEHAPNLPVDDRDVSW